MCCCFKNSKVLNSHLKPLACLAIKAVVLPKSSILLSLSDVLPSASSDPRPNVDPVDHVWLVLRGNDEGQLACHIRRTAFRRHECMRSDRLVIFPSGR